MNLNEFIEAFAGEFEDTDPSVFNADTKYKDLEEWGSLTALSIITMVDAEMEKTLTGADLRACETIVQLFNLIQNK